MDVQNISWSYLPQFIIRILILLFLFGLIVFGIIKCVQALRKNNFCGKMRMVSASIISILIVAISWMLNMGWLRVVMTFLLIPVIHSVFFFYVNLSSAKYFEESPKIKVLNAFFILTFLIAYIFMPDGGDIDNMYFFFGLIHNDTLSGIANFVSMIAFISHVVLLVTQIAEIKKIKKSISGNS